MEKVIDKEFDLAKYKEDVVVAIKTDLDFVLKKFSGFRNTPKVVSGAEDVVVETVVMEDGKLYNQIKCAIAVKDCFNDYVIVYKVRINPFHVSIENVRFEIVSSSKKVDSALHKFMVEKFGAKYVNKLKSMNLTVDDEIEKENNI